MRPSDTGWPTCGTLSISWSVGGPHPYPSIVRHFQSVIGKEARAQISQSRSASGCWLPASAAAATPWASSIPSCKDRAVRGGGSRRAWLPERPACRYPRPGPWVCCTAPSSLPPTRSRRQHPRSPFPGSAVSIIPAWVREHSYFKDTGRAESRGGERRRGPGGVSAALPHRRIRRPWKAPTRWPILKNWRRNMPRTTLSSSIFPAGATRTWTRWPRPWRCPATANCSSVQAAQGQGEKASIPFITAGDPDLATTKALALEMAVRGATRWSWASPSPICGRPDYQRRPVLAWCSMGCISRRLELAGEDTPGNGDSVDPDGR